MDKSEITYINDKKSIDGLRATGFFVGWAKLKEDLKKYYMVDVCCNEDVLPFYEGQGFKRGHSVIIRNYEQLSDL